MDTPRLTRLLVAASLGLVPLAAHAHPGLGLHDTLLEGALHPLTGADHLLTILCIGMWSAQQQGRLRGLLPLCFVALMLTGSLLGFGTPAPGLLEQALAATVLLSGLFVASRLRASAAPALFASGLFALLHGLAHGIEGPGTGPLAYTLGFTLATLLIGAAGFGLAMAAQQWRAESALRLTGGLVATAGLAMSVV